MTYKTTIIDSISAITSILLLGATQLYVVFALILGGLEPVLTWLRTGIFPDRDLLWLMSDSSCAQTNWIANGWDGMDACKLREIYITDWIGINNIINWFFDLQLMISGVAITGLMIIISALLELYLDRKH